MIEHEEKTIAEMLMRHEGRRVSPYRCSAGKLTVGYGRNMDDVEFSEDEIALMLYNDIKKATKELQRYQWFWVLNYPRRCVLVDMMYNLGPSRFAGFKKMIAALSIDDYDEAYAQAVGSKWYVQVGSRGIEVAETIKTGEFQ